MGVLAHSKCRWAGPRLQKPIMHKPRLLYRACRHPLLDVHELQCVSMHKESVWQRKCYTTIALLLLLACITACFESALVSYDQTFPSYI